VTKDITNRQKTATNKDPALLFQGKPSPIDREKDFLFLLRWTVNLLKCVDIRDQIKKMILIDFSHWWIELQGQRYGEIIGDWILNNIVAIILDYANSNVGAVVKWERFG
jgi:hypothetical protein